MTMSGQLNFIEMKRIIVIIAVALAAALHADKANACTGISLAAQDGSRVVARTVEWAATSISPILLQVQTDFSTRESTAMSEYILNMSRLLWKE